MKRFFFVLGMLMVNKFDSPWTLSETHKDLEVMTDETRTRGFFFLFTTFINKLYLNLLALEFFCF